MPKTWNAGVIGCGSIAQHLHLPGYARTPGVKVAAACDPEPARHKEVKKAFPDISLYPGYREMIKAHDLDVVSIASPNKFHAEHAIAALNSGAHVLLEKPAALSMTEVGKIKKAAKNNKRKVIVGFSQRFYRGNAKIHQLLKAGTIGEPYMLRIRFAHSGPFPGWAKDEWFYDPKKAGGGAMLDMGIHAIDLAQWFIGPISSVQSTAATLRKKIRVDDNALLIFEFARKKAMGYIEIGWTSPAGFTGVEIMGDAGYIVSDYHSSMRVTTGKVTPDLKKKPKLSTRVVDNAPTTGGWAVEVAECVKAFRKNSDLGCGIDAGSSALAVALAAYESSRTGKRVKVSSIK
jgi:predicted dehydrogenase